MGSPLCIHDLRSEARWGSLPSQTVTQPLIEMHCTTMTEGGAVLTASSDPQESWFCMGSSSLAFPPHLHPSGFSSELSKLETCLAFRIEGWRGPQSRQPGSPVGRGFVSSLGYMVQFTVA